MAEREKLMAIQRQIAQAKSRLLVEHPFYGRLLLHLGLAFGRCGTACTDGKKIIFDPDFAAELGEEELCFVLLHEVLHCVLDHFSRGKNRDHERFNIAADIVVNSMILEIMGMTEFTLRGRPVIHLAPNGKEGRQYCTEEIYYMLGPEYLAGKIRKTLIDSHESWPQEEDGVLSGHWKRHIRQTIHQLGANARLPPSLRNLIKDGAHLGADWRVLLHSLIRHDRSDFTFSPPDRRFSGDLLLPSFQENIYGSQIEKIWFCLDTSASMSVQAISAAYEEIQRAITQIGSLHGYLSYFDSDVTDPVSFESVEDILTHPPVGYGGTSFHRLFEKLNWFEEAMPRAIVIITDGRADFPSEEAARGIPTIWLMVESDVSPDWGLCAKLRT